MLGELRWRPFPGYPPGNYGAVRSGYGVIVKGLMRLQHFSIQTLLPRRRSRRLRRLFSFSTALVLARNCFVAALWSCVALAFSLFSSVFSSFAFCALD